MKLRRFSGLKVGLEEGREKQLIQQITYHGRACERSCRRLHNQSEQSLGNRRRDATVDYKAFSNALEHLKKFLNAYKRLVGNIVFKAEDEEAVDNFQSDMHVCYQRTEFDEQASKEKYQSNELIVPSMISEVRNVLDYVVGFLEECKRREGRFEENVVPLMRLNGGGMVAKDADPPEFFPAPETDVGGPIEEGDEPLPDETKGEEGFEDDMDDVEPVERDEGFELFKEQAQQIGVIDNDTI